MTRSLMIFGQGAIRCHPYVLPEMEAARIEDDDERIRTFDRLLFAHIGFGFSNAARSLLLGLSLGRLGQVPGDAYTRRFYRKLNRYSAALALAADVSMLSLGGKLKFKEKISGRLGDVLSYLYIASSMLKRYQDQGCPELDRPLLAWAFHECVWRMQQALDGVIRNFPLRPVAWLLRALIFPLGRWEAPPSDRLGRRVTGLLMAPNEARARLTELAYMTPTANNTIGRLDALLPDVIAAEPVERKFLKAVKSGAASGLDFDAQLADAHAKGIITADERDLIARVREASFEFIAVDDFPSEHLRAAYVRPEANVD